MDLETRNDNTMFRERDKCKIFSCIIDKMSSALNTLSSTSSSIVSKQQALSDISLSKDILKKLGLFAAPVLTQGHTGFLTESCGVPLEFLDEVGRDLLVSVNVEEVIDFCDSILVLRPLVSKRTNSELIGESVINELMNMFGFGDRVSKIRAAFMNLVIRENEIYKHGKIRLVIDEPILKKIIAEIRGSILCNSNKRKELLELLNKKTLIIYSYYNSVFGDVYIVI
nr:MAG: p25 [Grapevine leafroll-associated virus 7]